MIKSPPLFLIFIEFKYEKLLKLCLGVFGFIDGLLGAIGVGIKVSSFFFSEPIPDKLVTCLALSVRLSKLE